MEPHHNMRRLASPSVNTEQSDDNSIGSFNAKRPCVTSVGKPNSPELLTYKAEANILDVLNADCWRLVLNQLSINEVVRSERVSRAWQCVVLEYLAGVQHYWIMDLKSPEHYRIPLHKNDFFFIKNCRAIEVPETNAEVFQNMIEKMGPFFVSTTSRYINREMLKAIAANCPNLKELNIRFIHQPSADTENIGLFTKCKQLKRVTFDLTLGGDHILNEIITSEALEELTINEANQITGRFLNQLRTNNLTTLEFAYCKNLVIENIVSAVK